MITSRTETTTAGNFFGVLRVDFPDDVTAMPGSSAYRVVFWPQWGQSTVTPIPSAGNSMCAPHFSQEHFKWRGSLMGLKLLRACRHRASRLSDTQSNHTA